MKDTRRRFSREFKLEAVRQLASGRRQADVARELGVDAQVIRRWADQVKIDPTTAFPGNGRPPHWGNMQDRFMASWRPMVV